MPTEPNNLNENKSLICSVCHQPTLKEWYFCPNCGNKLSQAPLSTSAMTQAGIYAFSVLLPIICFLFITRWPGIKYIKSEDPKTKQIGIIALAVLIISTVVIYWLAYVETKAVIQSAVDAASADLSSYSL